jgi:hypothetical protein
MPFTCSICGEESTRICVRCTKDACNNHICEKCLRCSDCCECEVALSEPTHETVRMVVRAASEEVPLPESAAETGPDPEPEPEPHIPGPDPDPAPMPTPEEPGPAAA